MQTDDDESTVVEHIMRVAGFIVGGTVALMLVLGVLSLCGCVYKGAKVTEGTDFSAGIPVPATDGAVQFTLINYLSGFRVGVAENAMTTIKYTSTWTNSYLGMVSTQGTKTADITVSPCEVQPSKEESASDTGTREGSTLH